MDRAECVREYYRSLDDHDYEALDDLLRGDFVHDRPDLTLEGRERFVRFMREERPQTDTAHPIDGVYVGDGDDVVARGRLLTATGDPITEFVDVFSFDGGRIERLETFTK